MFFSFFSMEVDLGFAFLCFGQPVKLRSWWCVVVSALSGFLEHRSRGVVHSVSLEGEGDVLGSAGTCVVKLHGQMWWWWCCTVIGHFKRRWYNSAGGLNISRWARWLSLFQRNNRSARFKNTLLCSLAGTGREWCDAVIGTGGHGRDFLSPDFHGNVFLRPLEKKKRGGGCWVVCVLFVIPLLSNDVALQLLGVAVGILRLHVAVVILWWFSVFGREFFAG